MSTYAVLGAAGKVGFATSTVLRKAGVPVRAILRNESKGPQLRAIGCTVAVADFQDVDALAQAMENVDTVQLILPPSPLEDMLQTAECIASALERSQPRRILAISDYGAHVSKDIGMPSVFHLFEKRLSQLSGQKIFLRSAEHVENLARTIPVAMETSILSTSHASPHKPFPMVSASDVGQIAARLLLDAPKGQDVQKAHVEGPFRYSDSDVAATLGRVLCKQIVVQSTPRADWQDILGKFMPPSLATLIIKANDAQNEGNLVDVEPGCGDVHRGSTELEDALRLITTA